jgi:hypothetical protein
MGLVSYYYEYGVHCERSKLFSISNKRKKITGIPRHRREKNIKMGHKEAVNI